MADVAGWVQVAKADEGCECRCEWLMRMADANAGQVMKAWFERMFCSMPLQPPH
jgi:hypothetical protein